MSHDYNWKNKSLIDFYRVSLMTVEPAGLVGRIAELEPGEAVVCWGKAALSTWNSISSRAARKLGPALVIAPADSIPDKRQPLGFLSVQGARVVFGEHPLPGEGSFQAGAALLDFLESLERFGSRKLRVFLSGGASSLAWVKPAAMSRDRLLQKLRELYAKGLDIQAMNSRRSELCVLKAGGAARWALRLNPELKIRVEVISDVAPHPLSVVGSGPFWDPALRPRIRHHCLADNSTWVRSWKKLAERHRGPGESGIPVLAAFSNQFGDWQAWVSRTETGIRDALRHQRHGWWMLGGEPQVSLAARAGRGGRQTQIALGLAMRLRDEIAQGKVEILCASSDGVDGRAGAAGAFLDARTFPRDRKSILQKALRTRDSASVLKRCHSLLPETLTGTNVQDIVVTWIRPGFWPS